MPLPGRGRPAPFGAVGVALCRHALGRVHRRLDAAERGGRSVGVVALAHRPPLDTRQVLQAVAASAADRI